MLDAFSLLLLLFIYYFHGHLYYLKNAMYCSIKSVFCGKLVSSALSTGVYVLKHWLIANIDWPKTLILLSCMLNNIMLLIGSFFQSCLVAFFFQENSSHPQNFITNMLERQVHSWEQLINQFVLKASDTHF